MSEHAPDLLAPCPGFAILELSSRCNLGCAYCGVSQPGYAGRDLSVDPVQVIAELRTLGVSSVLISGNGESTVAPGWHLVAEALLDAGIAIRMTTNLARRPTDSELAVFARMEAITVSCDTVDAELFARLRPPARFADICANLAALRAALPPRGTPRPALAVHCVFTDRVVDGIADLVRWAAREELDTVALVNLFEYPDLDPDFPLRHPARVDAGHAARRIDEARSLAEELGITFHVMPGLHADLEEALESERRAAASTDQGADPDAADA